MSIRAMNWAMEQATGDPRAQCLLYVIADSANTDGIAWPSADWMAAKSQQSRATVYRRLEILQAAGLLVTFPRWIDDEGKIWNAAALGRRRTSPEIRLQFGVFVKRIDIPQDDDNDREKPSAQSQAETGVSHDSDGPVSPERQGSSHCGNDNHNPNLEEDSPPPPKGGAVDDGWEDFEKAWHEPILRQSIAQRVWSALTAEERSIAIKAAKGYITWRKGQKKPPNIINAHTFLREREAWPRFAELAPREAEQPIFETQGSDGWRARCVIEVIAGNAPPQALPHRTAGNGRYFAQPLSPAMLALAQFADEDPETWLLLQEGTQQCGAWKEFLGIQAHYVTVGHKRHEITPGQWVEDWPIKQHGLRAPRQWPPRKDGTLSTAGPPETLMTEQDMRDFA